MNPKTCPTCGSICVSHPDPDGLTQKFERARHLERDFLASREIRPQIASGEMWDQEWNRHETVMIPARRLGMLLRVARGEFDWMLLFGSAMVCALICTVVLWFWVGW